MSLRYCEILYLFRVADASGEWRDYLHVRWYAHGSKTILQEASHPHALYLTSECDDIDAGSVVAKCDVQRLASGDKEPLDSTTFGKLNYFLKYVCPYCFIIQLLTAWLMAATRYHWDEDQFSFTDLAQHVRHPDGYKHCTGYQECYCCELQARTKYIKEPRPLLESGFSCNGTAYHVQDFVYIGQDEPGPAQLLKIGQLVSFDMPGHTATIRLFARYDVVIREGQLDLALEGKPVPKDEVWFSTAVQFADKPTAETCLHRLPQDC